MERNDGNIANVIRMALGRRDDEGRVGRSSGARFGLDRTKTTGENNSKIEEDTKTSFIDECDDRNIEKRRDEDASKETKKRTFTRKRKGGLRAESSADATTSANHFVQIKVHGKEEECVQTTKKHVEHAKPKKKMTTHKQLYLDLGQKSFRHVNCSTCGLMYAKGEPSDEELHRKHHAKFLEQRDNAFVTVNVRSTKSANTNSFWNDELKQNWQEVEIRSEKCRIYRVTKGACDRHTWAKVKRVAKRVEAEIGAVEDWVLGKEDEKDEDLRIVVFVCVSFTGAKANEGKIVGAAFCEDIAANRREVFESVTKDERVKENDGAKNAGNGHGVLMKGAQIHLFPQKRDSVGIRALWVHKSFRRMGISHNLLENCRRRFYGDASMISSSTIVEKVKVAFSQPTHQGKLFIAKYADNDGKFLVYE